jgi:hypothetical protein
VRPTRAGVLVVLGVAAALVSFTVADLARWSPPPMPWTLPVVLLALALGVVVAGAGLRRRLRGAPGAKPVDPLAAARMAVLSKACSHGGSLLLGVYGGLAAYLLLEYDSDARRGDALLAALSALTSAAVVAAGLVLERICRVQPPDDEPPGAAAP